MSGTTQNTLCIIVSVNASQRDRKKKRPTMSESQFEDVVLRGPTQGNTHSCISIHRNRHKLHQDRAESPAF